MPFMRALATTATKLGGVRIRLTVLATVLMALALVVAGVTVCLLLRSSLQHTVDAAVSSRAHAVVATETVAGVDPEAVAPSGEVEMIAVISADGRLLIGTRAVPAAPVVPAVPAGQSRSLTDLTFGTDPSRYRAAVVGVQTANGPVRVVAATAQHRVDDVVVTVAETLAVVFPTVLVVLAMGSYLVSSRTLAPVERIRAQLAAISSSDLSSRVSVPARRDETAALAETMNDVLGRIESANWRRPGSSATRRTNCAVR